jgi:hypothetical protein
MNESRYCACLVGQTLCDSAPVRRPISDLIDHRMTRLHTSSLTAFSIFLQPSSITSMPVAIDIRK